MITLLRDQIHALLTNLPHDESTLHQLPIGRMVHRLTRDLKDRGASLKPGDDAKVVSLGDLPPAQKDLEVVIGGQREFLPVAFLIVGAARQSAVGRVRLKQPHSGLLAGSGWGSGFLIAPSLFLTNNHVVPDVAFATNVVRLQFNFQNDLEGNALPVDEFDLAPGDFFLTNPDTDLDYSLIRVKSKPGSAPGAPLIPPGATWGTIPVNEHVLFAKDQQVNIVQHPQGRPKEVVLEQNRITDVLPKYLHYQADTEPGSSGSPVFNNSWELVALHHSAGEQAPNGTYLNNEGIRIDKILADIRARAPQVAVELGL